MEEWKNSEQAIFAREAKDLIHLFDVRADIVMRKHNAFRLARAAAGKDHRRQIVERRGRCRWFIVQVEAASAESLFKRIYRHKQGYEQGKNLFRKPWICRHFLQENGLSWHRELRFLEKCFRRHYRLEIALANAR